MRKFLKRGVLILLILGALWTGLTYWANRVEAQSAGCPNPNPNLSAWTTLTGPLFQGLDTAPSVNCPLPAGTATTGLNGAITTVANAITAVNASITSLNNSVAALPTTYTSRVATNTALLALNSTAQSRVYRGGFYADGDGGALWYTPSASACTLNSGAGDNGLQVRSNDGKCWIGDIPAAGVSPQVWGAKGDGTTDDTAAIQAAASALSTSHGTLNLTKLYRLTGTITTGATNITGPFIGGGGIPINNPLDPCTVGFHQTTPNITTISVNTDGVLINGVCIDNSSISNTTNSSVGIFVGSFYHDRITQVKVYGACIGIDVNGTNGSKPNLDTVVDKSVVMSVDVSTCADIRMGFNSTGGNTIDSIITNNTLLCPATFPNGSNNVIGMQISDVGGPFISNNNIEGCFIGTYIIPGAGQLAEFLYFTDTVVGDSDKQYDLSIDTVALATTAQVRSVVFNNSWFASANSTAVNIKNTGGGTISGIHIVGSRIYPFLNQIGVNVFGPTDPNMTDITIDSSAICVVPGSTAAATVNFDFPGPMAFRDNIVGICDRSQPVSAPTGDGIVLATSAGSIDGIVTSNFFKQFPQNQDIVFSGTLSTSHVVIENNVPEASQPILSVPSAGTITTNQSSFTVSGSATITNLLPAWNGRHVTVIPAAGSTWGVTTGGNIATTGTSVVGKPSNWIYDNAWFVAF